MDTDIAPLNVPSADLVDRVKAALSGRPNEYAVEKMAKKTSKIDGRTKEFKSAIKRIEARKNKKREE